MGTRAKVKPVDTLPRQLERGELLYEGKAKRLFRTDEPGLLIQEFKDDLTAFNAGKRGSVKGKGEYTCAISRLLFEYLESYHIPTHFVRQISPREMLVKKVEIIKIEAVMRNIATGSLVKRLGMQEGAVLDFPVFEMYLKDDALGDPLINEYHAYALKLAAPEEIKAIYRMTAKVNAVLKSLFDRRGMLLVDFKLEFGRDGDSLLLADEISPDTCRIWDRKTRKKLDKDRFRQDLGGLEKAYKEVLERLRNA